MDFPPRGDILANVLKNVPYGTGEFPGARVLREGFQAEGGYFIPSEAMWSRVLQETGWKITGRNGITLSRREQDILSRVSLGGITAEDVEFPHATVYVDLPGSPLKIWGDDRTGEHPVRGVFVTSMRFEGTDRQGIAFYINGHPNKESIDEYDDANYWFTIPADTSEPLEIIIEKALLTPEVYPVDASAGARRSIAAARVVSRLGLHALLHWGEKTPEATRREAEMHEISNSLSRLKNHHKGKARRYIRRRTELEEIPAEWRLAREIRKGQWVKRDSLIDEARGRLRVAETATEKAAALLDLRVALNHTEDVSPRFTWEETNDG